MEKKGAARLAAAAVLAGLAGAPSLIAGGANISGNNNGGKLT